MDSSDARLVGHLAGVLLAAINCKGRSLVCLAKSITMKQACWYGHSL
jgi:hypothetical protein